MHQWDIIASQSSYTYNPGVDASLGRGSLLPELRKWFLDRRKPAWAKTQGLGGAIVWTINLGLIGDKDNALMQSVKKAFLE